MDLTRKHLRYAILDALPFEFKRADWHPDKRRVEKIVNTIFNVIIEKLLTEGEATIPYFGRFYLKKNSRRTWVRFKAATKLRRSLDD